MSKTADRLEQLSPEMRALLALKLKRQKQRTAGSGRTVPKLPRQDGENRFPLSYAQQRIMFYEEYMPGTERYNFANAYRFRGKLDTAALERALNAMVRRHEAMRIVVAVEGDEYVQVVRPELVIGLPVADLEDESLLYDWMERDAKAPFDFLNGPLVRAKLFRLSANEHVLVWMTHHLINDGWSVDVFEEELAELYRAYSLGEEPSVPELPVQYADFAVWQRAWMDGSEYERQMSYWKRQLGGELQTLDMPTDYPRPSIRKESRNALASGKLERAFAERIRAAAKGLGCTPFVFLLAAYKLMLASWNGKREVIVGTPMANRGLEEIEKLIGFFANTVTLRSKIDLSDRFDTFALRLRDTVFEATDHQELPFDRIVDELNPDRITGHALFFDTMFLFERHGQAQFELPELKIEPVAGDRTRGGMLDLTLTVFDSPDGGLEAALSFNPEIFRQSTAERMLAHYLSILARACEQAARPMYGIAAVTGSQFEQVTAGWNARSAEWADPVMPHRLVTRQAMRTPNRAAVSSEGVSYTYRELDVLSNRLAHALRARGVDRNRTVGLFMDRSALSIAGLLGIMKAGGVYVPLDSKLPAERLRTIVKEADVSLVVSEAVLAGDLTDGMDAPPDMLLLDAERSRLDSLPESPPDVQSSPYDLMYILFTSGSTGKPKGVAVEYRNYINYLQGVLERMDVEDGLHYAIVSTLAADLGTPMIWAAFATGGTVHVLPYERAVDPDAFSAYCKANPIDVMKIVPSHFEALLGALDPEPIVPRRLLIFAGEASYWETVRQVRRLRPGCRIQNHYGPTETTVSVLAYPIPDTPDPDAAGSPTLPLGAPLPNAPVYVLNAYMQPVPVGATGELYIGGSAVSRGYYGRPDLTAERFVPDPFAREPGGRLYRTGDLVRYRTDGTIQFIGRTDHQIKIRGYRVEIGEIEHLLQQIDGIRDAVVVLREDDPGDKRLVAYLVPERHQAASGRTELTVSDVRRRLKASLPEYMIPHAIALMERLPLNANGKLDRAALPAPSAIGGMSADAFEAPRTETERRIAAVWSEVLGLPDIGIDQEFFDSGGDSFKAIKVVRKLGNTFSVMDLFQYPTIRELAEFVDAGAAASGSDLLIEFKKASAIGGKAKTIVCVPYGGGSAITFQPLARSLPDAYALLAVQLPGHDYSRPDQPLAPLLETAQRCAAEIRAKAKGDIYLYGHCLGGAMVLQIGLLLEQAGVKVSGVFMAGTFPSARLPFRLTEWWHRLFPREKWTSDKFTRDMLRAFGGFDDEVSPEEQKFILRNLRHDAREAEDFYTALYAMPERPKLRAPIACIVGGADRMTEFYEERYSEWRDFAGDIRLHVVEQAGHYFHKHQSGYVGKLLAMQVRQWEEASGELAPNGSNARRAAEPAEASAESKPSVGAFLLVTMCLVIATIGTSLTGFALGIWAYEETGSISDYATISLFALLPTLLLLPVAGAVVDRVDRRKVMLAGQGLALSASVFMAVMLYTDALELWVIYVAASLGSIASAFIMPAYQAATAQLVPKRYLGNANGIGQLVFSLNGIMAPAIGGALVVMIGLERIILIDLVLLSASIVILSRLRFPDRLFKKREEPMLREITGGWKYIVNRKSLVAMVVFFVVVNFFMSLYNVLTAPFLLEFMSADKVGTVIAFEGAGLLAGSILMAIWGGFDRRADGMVGFVVLTGLSVALPGLFPSVYTAAAGLFGFGLALALINTHWLALIQTKVGLELQGRVLATNQVLAFSMRPLSFVLAGPLTASLFGPLADVIPGRVGGIGLFGTGDARAIGLLLATIGIILVIWAMLGMSYRPLRKMESILPDAIPDAVIIADKDRLQQMADRRLELGA